MTQNQDIKGTHQNKKVLALVSFIAIITLFYIVYATVQIHKQLNGLAKLTSTLNQQQKNNQKQIDERINTIETNQTELTRTIHEVSNKVDVNLSDRNEQSRDWLFLKARYFLELAEINRRLGDNSQATVVLLQEAQALIKDEHAPGLYAIKQAIAKEQAELETTPSLDYAALLSQLNEASSLVNKLEPKKPRFIPPKDNVNQSAATWQGQLRNNLLRLEKLIVIRQHDEAIQPLVTPEDEIILRNNIQLALQQAQWAVLRHNDAVYTLSLTQATKTLQQSFDPASEQTKSLLNQLSNLQQIKFTPQQPLSNESLILMNQFIDSKQSPTSGEPSA